MSIKSYFVITTLYLALVVFHILASWNQTTAHVIPDEVSYLAQARYFSGKDITPDTEKFLKQESSFSDNDILPSTEGWHYYHFGYSLLVAPIYWLSDSHATAYKGIMVFNSFLLSTLFIIIFTWIRMIRDINFHNATAIAFIVSLYPAYILQAHIGWAENALIPGFALCCLLFTYHLKVRNISSVILFAGMAGLQFTIHPRGIASTIAAIICLFGLFLVEKNRWQLSIIGLFIIALITAATKVMANDIALLMNTATQDSTIIKNLSSVLQFKILTATIGNLLYLTLATLGLFLLGITESIQQVVFSGVKNLKKLATNEYTGSLIYILIASSLTFCLSIVFLGRGEAWHDVSRSLDFFLYGRYNEAFLSIYIALGLLKLCDIEHPPRDYSRPLNLAFWVLAIICLVYLLYLIDYRYLRSIHSFGLFPWYFLSTIIESQYSNAIIFFAPLVWTWLVLQLSLQNIRKGLLIVGIYFLLLNISLIIYIAPELQIFTT